MEELLERALKLPEAERAALAHDLLLSLEPEHQDEDYEEAWAEEIEARLQRLDSGESQPDDLENVMHRLRASLTKGKRQ